MKTQFWYTSPVLASTTQWPAVATIDLLPELTASPEQAYVPDELEKNTLPAVVEISPPEVQRCGELAAGTAAGPASRSVALASRSGVQKRSAADCWAAVKRADPGW